MNPNNNNININIRGVSSMNNNDPLVVIDGMAANDINAMNLLNPNDIESVSVLKDAGGHLWLSFGKWSYLNYN